MDKVTLTAHAGFRTLEASMTLLRRAIDWAVAIPKLLIIDEIGYLPFVVAKRCVRPKGEVQCWYMAHFLDVPAIDCLNRPNRAPFSL
jgi:hypothetical protein